MPVSWTSNATWATPAALVSYLADRATVTARSSVVEEATVPTARRRRWSRRIARVMTGRYPRRTALEPRRIPTGGPDALVARHQGREGASATHGSATGSRSTSCRRRQGRQRLPSDRDPPTAGAARATTSCHQVGAATSWRSNAARRDAPGARPRLHAVRDPPLGAVPGRGGSRRPRCVQSPAASPCVLGYRRRCGRRSRASSRSAGQQPEAEAAAPSARRGARASPGRSPGRRGRGRSRRLRDPRPDPSTAPASASARRGR